MSFWYLLVDDNKKGNDLIFHILYIYKYGKRKKIRGKK